MQNNKYNYKEYYKKSEEKTINFIISIDDEDKQIKSKKGGRSTNLY